MIKKNLYKETQFDQIFEYLSANYPHWTLNEVRLVTTRVLHYFKPDYINNGIKPIEFVSEGCAILEKRHPNFNISCGYWMIKHHLEEIRKKIYKNTDKNQELIDDNFKKNELEDKREFDDESLIEIYADEIKKHNKLTPQQSELFDLLIDLSNSNLDGDIYKLLNRVSLELGIIDNETSFRKAYQRLREKLLDSSNSETNELLYFTPNEKADKQNILNKFILSTESLIFNSNTNLKAYRFSEYEFNRMIELKNIFEANNYKICRFPEIYIDNEHMLFDENIKKINIDKLGCYLFDIKNDNSTSEGIIIIYTKSIEFFCHSIFKQRIHLDINKLIDAVKLIVLIHELGHWLSHWPEYFEKNWSQGYNDEKPMTHESLAQIMVCWAIKENDFIKSVFEKYLTPYENENPYSLYKGLMPFEHKEILMRLHHIRINNNLSDEDCYKILSCNNKNKYSDMHRHDETTMKFGF